MIRIREALICDADRLFPLLRAGDLAECAAYGDPLHVLRRSVVNSVRAWCALDDGEPLALWGYLHDGDGYQVWCLTGRGIERHKRRMLAENAAFVAAFEDTPIWSYVLASYASARRWLAWLGFREAGMIMIGGETFLRVEHDGRGGDRSGSTRRGRCFPILRPDCGGISPIGSGSAERSDCDAERADGGVAGRR